MTSLPARPGSIALVLVVGLPAALVLLDSGCSRASKPGDAKPSASGVNVPSASDTGSEETPEAAESASAAPSAAPVATGCEGRMQEFDKVLASATFNCQKDADCVCYPGGLSRGRGSECGGIVDAPTGKKLAAIEKAAKPEHCSNGSMCEPWECAPICEENRCQKGPRKGKKK